MYVRLHLDEQISVNQIEANYGIGHSLVSAWVKQYLEDGENALEPHNGNPYAALHWSKSLSYEVLEELKVKNNRPAAALGYKSPVQYKTELGFQ